MNTLVSDKIKRHIGIIGTSLLMAVMLMLSLNFFLSAPRYRNLLRALRCQESAFMYFKHIMINEQFKSLIIDSIEKLKYNEIVTIPYNEIDGVKEISSTKVESIRVNEATLVKADRTMLYITINVDDFMLVTVIWNFEADTIAEVFNGNPTSWLFDRPELYYPDIKGHYRLTKWGDTIEVSTRLL